ncbi:MAG TPA: alkaline phosphatase family protein [Vicinamibacterales bacterium]|nr:alkaline phosphatase family protein [Vicinamibacterales bacterium]
MRFAAAASVALALGLGADGQPATQPTREPPSAPKLIVMLVVDQMRFDYIDRYGKTWNRGLDRLVTEGAVFERAFYPYLNTVTCAGHATIGTGTLPYRHGVIMNEWYRRPSQRRMSCTDDPTARSVPYTAPAEPIGHSPNRLRVPTLGDRLRDVSPTSRAVVLSMKPRSTVMLAGRRGTAVSWFADTNVWATSTAYAPAPVAAVQQFVTANPVERERNEVWQRVRPASDYVGTDASAHERPRTGWTSTFPHPLSGAAGTAADRFFDFWERSPYSDAYLGRMAAALTRTYQLGQRDAVDYLAISFSALDYVGHDFGPASHEVQDTLFRLDRTLGDLFDVLDATVGRDRYAVAVSADHGVSAIPEALRAAGGDAGRVLNTEVQKAAEAAMIAAHGPGSYVAHVEYSNVYLTDEARHRAQQDRAFVQPLVTAVSQMPGVLRVFPAHDLPSKRESVDPVERAAALGHHPEESGEIVVVLWRNWIGTNTSAATHGSGHWYDQHVPVIFMGPAFKRGRYTTAASPADLAPTLASLIRLAMTDIDGRVLTDALH